MLTIIHIIAYFEFLWIWKIWYRIYLMNEYKYRNILPRYLYKSKYYPYLGRTNTQNNIIYTYTLCKVIFGLLCNIKKTRLELWYSIMVQSNNNITITISMIINLRVCNFKAGFIRAFKQRKLSYNGRHYPCHTNIKVSC